MDFTKNPTELLFELINTLNGTSVLATDFTVDAPGAGVKEGFNATIKVTALETATVTGSQTFNYNRIDLADVGVLSGADFAWADGLDEAGVLALINTRYGFALTAADVTISALTEPADGATTSFTVEVNAGHIVLFGTLEATLGKAKGAVAELLPQTDLAGFEYEE